MYSYCLSLAVWKACQDPPTWPSMRDSTFKTQLDLTSLATRKVMKKQKCECVSVCAHVPSVSKASSQLRVMWQSKQQSTCLHCAAFNCSQLNTSSNQQFSFEQTDFEKRCEVIPNYFSVRLTKLNLVQIDLNEMIPRAKQTSS